MRLQMMLMVVLVVFAALITAKPHYQSRRPQCKVGSSWPAEDGCNTCTCREDRSSYACTRHSCNSLEQQVDNRILEQRIDNGAIQSNNQDALQALEALAKTNSEQGEWLPFDINGYVFNWA